jgi:hypothetical protein
MFVGVLSCLHLTFGRPLRVWFENHPQLRFDLFGMSALNLAAGTPMPAVKSSGWVLIFSERRIAQIPSIRMASMDASLLFLVSPASVGAAKRLVSVWSCMLQNRSLLK